MSKQNELAQLADAVTVDGSNVGIGTTSPSTKLSVTGGYISQVNAGVSTYLGEDGSGGSLVGTTSNHYFRFITNNTERLRIDSDGLKFNGDTAAANALNDYEEGTWTPTVNAGSLNIGSCKYTKVGRLVTLTLDVVVATGGATQILNAPFTAVNTVGNPIFTSAQNFNTSRTVPTIIIGGGTGTMYFRDIGDNVSWLAMPLTTGASISFSFTYLAT